MRKKVTVSTLIIFSIVIMLLFPYIKAKIILKYTNYTTKLDFYSSSIIPEFYNEIVLTSDNFIEIEDIIIYDYLDGFDLLSDLSKNDQYFFKNDELLLHFETKIMNNTLISIIQEENFHNYIDLTTFENDYKLHQDILKVTENDLKPFMQYNEQKNIYSKLMLKNMLYILCNDLKLIETEKLEILVKYTDKFTTLDSWDKKSAKFIRISISKLLNEQELKELISSIDFL